MTNIKSITVKSNLSIRKSIKKMDENGYGIIICLDGNDFVVGIVTNGDFRRAILSGVDLSCPIKEITNTNFIYLTQEYTKDDALLIFREERVDQIPILNNKKLADIIFKHNTVDKVNSGEKVIKNNIEIIIMAGGIGTRLLPLTKIIPKPLIPIGDKTILERIIDQYKVFNNKIHISVNYKSEMIKSYLERSVHDCNIVYLNEKTPLGTVGALYQLNKKIFNTILLTNCDSIINENLDSIIEYHKSQNNNITIIGALRHYPISYGVCDINKDGQLIKLDEKPELDFVVNSGTYLFEPDVLNLIPINKKFHATDLIKIALLKKMNVGVYPITSEKWIDIGQFKEYKQLLNKIS
jgi:dTDP-glucose pyrophosphorylase